MKAELAKTFRFDAAHSLPNAPPGHKCAQPHGHSYRVDVHVAGHLRKAGVSMQTLRKVYANLQRRYEQGHAFAVMRFKTGKPGYGGLCGSAVGVRGLENNVLAAPSMLRSRRAWARPNARDCAHMSTPSP